MKTDTLIAIVKTAKELGLTTPKDEDRTLRKNSYLKAIERLLKNLGIEYDVLTLEEAYYQAFSEVTQ